VATRLRCKLAAVIIGLAVVGALLTVLTALQVLMGLSEAAEYSMLNSAITSVQEVYLLGDCFYTLQEMQIDAVVCRACCVVCAVCCLWCRVSCVLAWRGMSRSRQASQPKCLARTSN
jgi:mannose/fructose/N-acetylgalactosamine-specific phosphotransferase system component IID